MPKDFKHYMEFLTFSYFAIIHLDSPDDFFRTYTLPYQKTIKSIEKCQKESELVENRDFKIPITHHLDSPKNNASNDGWVYDFYEVRNFSLMIPIHILDESSTQLRHFAKWRIKF